MQKTTISNAKLKKAKQQLKGQMALSMDSNSGLMHGFGKSFLAFGQIDTIQQIHNSIDGISAEQLKSLAEKYMDPSQVSILEFDIK
jgi:predicted Zn-dependent peptidase